MHAISNFCTALSAQNLNTPVEKVVEIEKNADSTTTVTAKITVENLHKTTKERFSDVITEFYNAERPMISENMHNIVMKNAERLDAAIVHDRDYNFNYFALKVLENSFLWKINGKIVERPQHMLMRLAVGIHGEDIDAAIETYNQLSEHYFMHEPSALLTIGKSSPQMSSSFLLSTVEDSIDGIYETLSRCALVSRFSGAIGLNVHGIRAKGSKISTTGGKSNGIIPMLRVFRQTAKYADHGGKRPGIFAIYLEPWHDDIYDFINLHKNIGHEEERCRDLFLALWIPDLFMKRVEADEMWSLMCPNKSPGLYKVWGDEFEVLYMKYEKEGTYVRQVKARDLWFQIVQSQIETGTPYMLYKDTCNRKSNQQNLGTIRGGSFCSETVQYTDCTDIAVNNQASIAVNKFVKPDKTYDFVKLKEISKIVTRNLNKIIDVGCYPLKQCEESNKRHRPIGIGIQGLADAFIQMRFPYESEQAAKLNQQIFETIYYGALEASCELAEKDGPYETYDGSPISKGILQYDMWEKTPTALWDWDGLKKRIAKHGVRNSSLLALMPTTATAEILESSDSFEPHKSYISNVSNQFQVINPHLVAALKEVGIWNDAIRAEIIENHGSIQSIARIPQDIRNLYKTAWEIPIKTTMNMAADRGAFIDQSQAFNIYSTELNYAKMSSMHFYTWKLGLKTGMYYNRNQLDENIGSNYFDTVPMQTALISSVEDEQQTAALVCSIENKEDCMMCGA